MSATVPAAAARLCAAIALASRGLVEREALVELVALAAVAGEHVLVIGPPGTAKSEAVRRAARSLGGQYFEYLLGRFTEPAELFGPVDLRRLREGVIEVETAGMLPEAEVAFLDEVFLGSTAILNTLLTILNERTFRRGSTRRACPLRVCVCASNALPDDDALAPFADRFLVRTFLEPVPDARLEDLLAGGWNLSPADASPAASMADVDLLSAAARTLDLAPVRPALAHAIRLLRRAQINLSDRRAVRVQRLVAAAAVLAGRTVASEEDLWPLLTAVPTREEQATARDVLRDVLARSRNGALRAASEDASAGPLARARRIAADADALLSRGPDAPLAREPASDPHVASPDPREAFRLRLEGVLREIDASFAPGAVPSELAAVRPRLIAALDAFRG